MKLKIFTRDKISIQRHAGMRYRGQSYEVSVLTGPMHSKADLQAISQAFHTAHERRYGHMAANETIEIVNVKVVGAGLIDKPGLPVFPVADTQASTPANTRKAFFGGDSFLDTPVFDRLDLAAGQRLSGPAIVEEKTSTIVIYPGQTAVVDEYLNLEISVPLEL